MQRLCLIFSFLFLWTTPLWGADFPITFTDSSGREVTLAKRPERVVSLVPSVTEMLLRIGVDEELLGITHHSVLPSGAAGKTIIGGFFDPDLERVARLQPEVIFYAAIQKEVLPRFKDTAILIELAPRSIEGGFDDLLLLGRLFGREAQAEAIVQEERRQLLVIAQKTAAIPQEDRKRVMRLMGRRTIMAPGDDSFQNDYIRAAGGVAPMWGEDGNIVAVGLDEWQGFNPQILYGCGGDIAPLAILDQPGWRDVEAVHNGKPLFFPCDLTCRAATHPGYFVSWLSARIYGDVYGKAENNVLPEKVIRRKPLILDLDYVERAEIIYSDIKDFRNKTLAVRFTSPMTIVSTLEGQRQGISTVANHYFPPPAWGLGHDQGLQGLRDTTLAVLGLDGATTSILFTGADMDNLAVVTKEFRDMRVTALVTAGVQGNAVRMGADTGRFYEPDQEGRHKKPGTINILLLTNMQLSPRAMTRGIISATEGKTAALQDMDIRSSYSRTTNQATGTGTDNIVVVQGAGVSIDSSGGHSKMGELMARAVYEGVQQAVLLQNGLIIKRPIFQRLKERRVDLRHLSKLFTGIQQSAALHRAMESLLLEDSSADFLKGIFAVSDDYEKGLVTDLTSVDLWCQAMADRVAGGTVVLQSPDLAPLPLVLGKGLAALFSGLAQTRPVD